MKLRPELLQSAFAGLCAVGVVSVLEAWPSWQGWTGFWIGFVAFMAASAGAQRPGPVLGCLGLVVVLDAWLDPAVGVRGFVFGAVVDNLPYALACAAGIGLRQWWRSDQAATRAGGAPSAWLPPGPASVFAVLLAAAVVIGALFVPMGTEGPDTLLIVFIVGSVAFFAAGLVAPNRTIGILTAIFLWATAVAYGLGFTEGYEGGCSSFECDGGLFGVLLGITATVLLLAYLAAAAARPRLLARRS